MNVERLGWHDHAVVLGTTGCETIDDHLPDFLLVVVVRRFVLGIEARRQLLEILYGVVRDIIPVRRYGT
jgi:hypothetical protein